MSMYHAEPIREGSYAVVRDSDAVIVPSVSRNTAEWLAEELEHAYQSGRLRGAEEAIARAEKILGGRAFED
jgi:hypothetical protein